MFCLLANLMFLLFSRIDVSALIITVCNFIVPKRDSVY